MAEKKVTLPKRCRRYGVGKAIGGAVYVHRSYEHLLGPPVEAAKLHLPENATYAVVKYREATGTVSFIASPDFDTATEPTVGDVWVVSAEGRVKHFPPPVDPFIYHHKWLFVADDYSGFNVEESKARSRAWMTLPGVDYSRIGKRSFWKNVISECVSNPSLL